MITVRKANLNLSVDNSQQSLEMPERALFAGKAPQEHELVSSRKSNRETVFKTSHELHA